MTDGSNNAGASLAWQWQMPALVLGVLLLAVGWYVALPGEPPRDIAAEIASARQDVAAGEFDAALAKLDAALRVYEQLPEAQKIAYHLARGDAIAQGQRARKLDNPQNHQNIVKHYREAQALGHALDDRRMQWLTESLIALNKPDEANELVDAQPADSPLARQSMRREALGAAFSREGPTDDIIQALRRFLADPALERKHQIWTIARLAEAAMQRGEPGDAADLLMRWLQRLEFAQAQDVGELMVLLGHAQLALGDHHAAERWYLQAQPQLEPGDPLHGEALAGLGRVRFAEDNIVEALEYFTDAVSSYPDSAAYVQTLIGKAECEARLGWVDASLTSYDKAVQAVQAEHADPRDRDRLARSLRTQRDWRFAQEEFETALSYLKREDALHEPDLPANLLLKLALTHERIADHALGVDSTRAIDARQALEGLAQQKRLEVAGHYEQAAGHYHAHAQAVAKDRVDEYGESLWRAADCYDKSGLHEEAIAVFQEYAATRPQDPRQLHVTFRLAQAYQAEARFDEAIALYRQLQQTNPKSPEAYDALVPLARCYLAKGLDSWGLAEHVLKSVVTDHEALRPESNEYREALIELGRLYYRRGETGDYEKAIEALSEAVERYGDDEQLPDLLFQLGDASRKSVLQIDDRLRQPLPPSERVALQAERANRLAEALKAFDRVITLYESRDAEPSELQVLYLRNAYFYRADCAYDLGRYEGAGGAIELYDIAAKRFEQDPSVLVAQIQIVNSYCELGKYDQARTANERAKWLLKRIRDDAFDDPNLPMTREHWQRWLDWTSELSMTGAAASASP